MSYTKNENILSNGTDQIEIIKNSDTEVIHEEDEEGVESERRWRLKNNLFEVEMMIPSN